MREQWREKEGTPPEASPLARSETQTYQAHPRSTSPGETDVIADVDFTALMDLHPGTRLVRRDDFFAKMGLRERLSEIRQV